MGGYGTAAKVFTWITVIVSLSLSKPADYDVRIVQIAVTIISFFLVLIFSYMDSKEKKK